MAISIARNEKTNKQTNKQTNTHLLKLPSEFIDIKNSFQTCDDLLIGKVLKVGNLYSRRSFLLLMGQLSTEGTGVVYSLPPFEAALVQKLAVEWCLSCKCLLAINKSKERLCLQLPEATLGLSTTFVFTHDEKTRIKHVIAFL